MYRLFDCTNSALRKSITVTVSWRNENRRTTHVFHQYFGQFGRVIRCVVQRYKLTNTKRHPQFHQTFTNILSGHRT